MTCLCSSSCTVAIFDTKIPSTRIVPVSPLMIQLLILFSVAFGQLQLFKTDELAAILLLPPFTALSPKTAPCSCPTLYTIRGRTLTIKILPALRFFLTLSVVQNFYYTVVCYSTLPYLQQALTCDYSSLLSL